MKILVVCLILLTMSGCYTGEASESVAEKQSDDGGESEHDTVHLSSIVPPVFGDSFASLESGEAEYSATWAVEGDPFAWKESGYPGFGYPIVIEFSGDFFCGDTCILNTSWGEYEYAVEGRGFAFEEERVLVDSESGKCIVDFASKEECLILWCSSSKQYCKMKFIGGTRVVSDES